MRNARMNQMEIVHLSVIGASLVAQLVKNLPAVPGSGRSSGEENGNPLQYYFLGNAMNRGSWRATVHGVRKRVRHDLATEQQQTDTYSTKSKPSCTQIRKKIFGEVMNPGRNEDYNKGI